MSIIALYKLALREHYHCDDSWYSCPKDRDGCADESQGSECNCGADKHNAEVNRIYVAIKLEQATR